MGDGVKVYGPCPHGTGWCEMFHGDYVYVNGQWTKQGVNMTPLPDPSLCGWQPKRAQNDRTLCGRVADYRISRESGVDKNVCSAHMDVALNLWNWTEVVRI